METHQSAREFQQRGLAFWIGSALIAAIRLYRLCLSPWLGPHCRFDPTCSVYAIDAITLHGPIKGLWLAACRILKCHPWHRGGSDPVPINTKTHDNHGCN